MWTLAFGYHQERCSPTYGYAATGEAAMAGFEKSWRRGSCIARNDGGRVAHGAPTHV
jgi:hypothetical protein